MSEFTKATTKIENNQTGNSIISRLKDKILKKKKNVQTEAIF